MPDFMTTSPDAILPKWIQGFCASCMSAGVSGRPLRPRPFALSSFIRGADLLSLASELRTRQLQHVRAHLIIQVLALCADAASIRILVFVPTAGLVQHVILGA